MNMADRKYLGSFPQPEVGKSLVWIGMQRGYQNAIKQINDMGNESDDTDVKRICEYCAAAIQEMI